MGSLEAAKNNKASPEGDAFKRQAEVLAAGFRFIGRDPGTFRARRDALLFQHLFQIMDRPTDGLQPDVILLHELAPGLT